MIHTPTNATDPLGLASKPTLGDIIVNELFGRILGSIFANRIHKSWFGDRPVVFRDRLGEMKDHFNADMQGHYRSLLRDLAAGCRLTDEWQRFSIDTNNVRSLNQNGRWVMNSQQWFDTGWWLYGAHRVSSEVSFSARVSNGRIEVAGLSAEWTWYDEIDARNLKEWWQAGRNAEGLLAKLGWIANGLVESVFWDNVFDKLADTDFRIQIKWADNYPFVLDLGPSNECCCGN